MKKKTTNEEKPQMNKKPTNEKTHKWIKTPQMKKNPTNE